ncbi:regulatory-associated protein of mTOR isoform X1 [Histomonas meleagridis]|uniref:regulatory-associated protein of mTOR isoform X1 n=1 Tax=Histomonas meleagridis TaxID=135588 RepID=UPI003559537D|nr:regulatory-associated protein of mTOR isoform X1 [Histomonas meleagridis]KAH0806029.1 regulatory-associated protein of mTOR isoform X1 [Histomonas meleagridis]
MNANPLTRCFQQNPPIRRSVRASQVTHSRANPQTQAGMSQKTKYAICFLCLFDGLRTPSIRRLVRKPRTICGHPLLTFDPSFYSPSSKQALKNQYSRYVYCPCEITVDPSVETVIELLKKHASSLPPQNVILHYYGHGCHPPTSDGYLFFFSENRSRYKPIKIQNIINTCSCPLCFILDCPFAAVLAPHLSTRPNIFAFMACSSSEYLPLSTDCPMDLFSSCLLSPFETALSFHMRQHNSIYNEPRAPDKSLMTLLEKMFASILESILFDTQTQTNVELFVKDPSIALLTRGFILAQRVMLSFNLHPVSIPALKPMASHPLWDFWDIAVDFAITLPEEEAGEMIFKLFIESFRKFPNSGYFPLFSFLLKMQKFSQEAAKVLFDYLDSDENILISASRSGIAMTIIEMSKPSNYSLLILAKIVAKGMSQQFNQQTSLNFINSDNSEIIKCGILALCCAITNQFIPSTNRLITLCIEHAIDCAPYSAMLLGQILMKAGRLLGVPSFYKRFLPLLNDERSDIRAAAVYVLGFSKDKTVINYLTKLMDDNEPIVRMTLIDAFNQLAMDFDDGTIRGCLNKLKDDKDETVRENYRNVANDPQNNVPMILSMLIKSVSKSGFGERMKVNALII